MSGIKLTGAEGVSGAKKGSDTDTISGGFIQDQHGKPCVEVTRPDELSHPVVDLDTHPLAKHPRPWTKLPRNKKSKLATAGMNQNILDRGDPRFAAAMKLAKGYRRTRSSELSNIHGFVSAGANAMLSSASLALASSRYLYEKFAETGDVNLITMASRMADSARQSELAAWEMSAREGAVKRKLDSAATTMPWLVSDSGKELKKPGRKTNQERADAERQNDAPVLTVEGYLADATDGKV